MIDKHLRWHSRIFKLGIFCALLLCLHLFLMIAFPPTFEKTPNACLGCFVMMLEKVFVIVLFALLSLSLIGINLINRYFPHTKERKYGKYFFLLLNGISVLISLPVVIALLVAYLKNLNSTEVIGPRFLALANFFA